MELPSKTQLIFGKSVQGFMGRVAALSVATAIAVTAGGGETKSDGAEAAKATSGASAPAKAPADGDWAKLKNRAEVRTAPGYGEGDFCGTVDGMQEKAITDARKIDDRTWVRVVGAIAIDETVGSDSDALCSWTIATEVHETK